MARLLDEHKDQVAGMIIEPVMMNAGIIKPRPGYLEALKALLREHAHWLYQHNGGVFLPPWGKIEQWLISVQHDETDIDRLIDNFGAFARAVSPDATRTGD